MRIPKKLQLVNLTVIFPVMCVIFFSYDVVDTTEWLRWTELMMMWVKGGEAINYDDTMSWPVSVSVSSSIKIGIRWCLVCLMRWFWEVNETVNVFCGSPL